LKNRFWHERFPFLRICALVNILYHFQAGLSILKCKGGVTLQ
jgi:hypothetical protein